MATRYSIGQQIMKMLEGDPATNKKFAIAEIYGYVNQFINGLIKTQHITDEMGLGETIPDGSVLAEYDNVAVENYKNTARSLLPAMPVKLPLNMGIYHVSKTDDIINGFIPFQPGELQMIGSEPMISDILGQIGYWPAGKHIYYNKDITANQSEYRITSVYMLLVVKDLSLTTDFEMLPIAASMEWDVVNGVYQMLASQMPANKKVDVVNKQQEVTQ